MSLPNFLRPAALAAALCCLVLFAAGCNSSAEAAPRLGFTKVTSVSQPTWLGSPPGYPRLTYVTGRLGKVWILRGGKRMKRPLMDVGKRTNPLMVEQGLLGLTFAPDFKRSGRFYVFYTGRNGDAIVEENRSRRGKPRVLVPGSRRTVIRIPRVHALSNHNAGYIAFLGNLLYIAVGDGNDPGDKADLAQNPDSLRGKILRIDPRGDPATGRGYRIPPGNPFVGKQGRDEVFAYGFRNPHRFAFHRDADGQNMIAIYDVGQLRYEELNYLPLSAARGANFGWNGYEGFEPYNCGEEICPNGAEPAVTEGLTWPQLVYSHDKGCAIIGGPVIQDPALTTVKGRLIYGDFCFNRIRTAAPAHPEITDDKSAGFYLPPGKDEHSALNGFGVDGFKRVYAFSNKGGVYRLVQRPR